MRESEVLRELAGAMNYRNSDGTRNRLMKSEVDAIQQEEYDMLVAQQENKALKIPATIDELLNIAWSSHASDVHLSAGAPPKFRVYGQLRAIPTYAILKPVDIERILKPILKEEQMLEFEQEGDLDFAYAVRGIGRFRCNYYKQRGAWSAVFRLLADKIPTPEELGIPLSVMNLTKRKRGLVLVTGPTGSGKSTTLAAMINAINMRDQKNIITLEDPIEYTHKHGLCNINQREIGSDSKSFASALRAALRQDPDVILVGEMRDFETISTAVTAAETGHLVLSTLHTLGAADTINRIVDTYPEKQQNQARAQLAGCLEGIISQQLVPKADGSGRVAAFEILFGTNAIKANIRDGHIEQIPNSMQSARKEGMISLDQSLYELVSRNIISEDEAIKFATSPQAFANAGGINVQSRPISQGYNNPFGRRS